MNWFEFKGLTSERFKNLRVQELPPIIRPEVRSEFEYTDNVDGAVVMELGYDMVYKPISVGLKNLDNLDQIMAWLTGAGDITFSNEPDKIYKGKIINQISFERLGRFRIATIEFVCQPFKYLKNDTIYNFNSAGTYHVYNNGTVESLPLVEIYAEGNIEIKHNGILKITLNLGAGGRTVFLDSETQNAYNMAGALQNSRMTGDFIKLKPGDNLLTFSTENGTITKLSITPRSRFI